MDTAPPFPRRLSWCVAPLLATVAIAVVVVEAAAPRFVDVTTPAGIRFTHANGAFGRKYLPETMGSGVAFLDADGDGRQDLLFVNSTTFRHVRREEAAAASATQARLREGAAASAESATPGRRGEAATGPATRRAGAAEPVMALYHNNGNGTFTDVTARAGLAVPIYGIGVAAADYDNDGRVDIYIAALGRNRLFRNRGGLVFEDVTARAGVDDRGFSTSAAWLDYDRDGRLDLFVANYVQWSEEKDLFCTLDGEKKSYCTPESYKGQSPALYRNRGDGTFENATKRAGLDDPTSKALGVALTDYNNDGWLDLFVANDTQPNQLYENRRNGTFVDVATIAGVAFNEAGVARAGMGVDAADYDGSGRQSLVIGNFSNEMMALYTNEGNGLYVDEAPRATIGRASLLTLTFGCFFFDYDLDGLLDVFAANGHVADDINAVQPRVTYAQVPHLFRNKGSRQFDEVTAASGPGLAQRFVGRGAAYGDFDEDGDLDLVVTTNNGPAHLLRNDGGNANHYLRLQLVGTRVNRDAVGSLARVLLPGGAASPWAMVKTGSSYASQSELPLTFGLGRAVRVEKIEIKWPDGRTETLPGAAADQQLVITEGKGVTARAPGRGRSTQ